MKPLKIATVISLLVVLATSAAAHKFYVSVTQVEHNGEEKSLQIISKYFLDDLEATLRVRYNNPNINIASYKETSADVSVMKKYLMEKLKISVNGKPLQLNYIGHEYLPEEVKLYIEATGVQTVETITFENKALMEMYTKQQNIVHYKQGETRRSITLEKDKPKQMLKLK
ncbi:MAG: DUF6702 family protein [Marinirhabdus sp.]